nr:MAG TPA: terminase large subunit [Caudoviricetes sp.]
MEPKSIQYYRQEGFTMYGCKKYAGSKLQNVKKINGTKINTVL